VDLRLEVGLLLHLGVRLLEAGVVLKLGSCGGDGVVRVVEWCWIWR
jgi:hypothetical protein